MNRQSCNDCHQPIPNGKAWIRSVAFEQVAFCFDCWAARWVGMDDVRFARGAGEVIREARARQASDGVAEMERHLSGVSARMER